MGGRGGSDRSNVMEMQSMRQSYPMTYDQHESLFDNVNCKWPLEDAWLTPADCKIILATAGYYTSEADAIAGDGQNNGNVDPLLNNVSGAFRQGLMIQVRPDTPAGDYYMLSTRNNNFSNRAQKMKIKVAQDGSVATQTPAAFQAYPTENVEDETKKKPGV